MIQEFVDRFMARKDDLRKQFAKKHPDCYEDIVRLLADLLQEDDYGCDTFDMDRFTVVAGHGYQGCSLYVLPSTNEEYYAVSVDYGSCSACDTLEGILSDSEEDEDYNTLPPTESQIDDYMTLALHIAQEIKEI